MAPRPPLSQSPGAYTLTADDLQLTDIVAIINSGPRDVGVPMAALAEFFNARPWVTPELYGARGDGVAGTDTVAATGTDDTAAFQAALDYLVEQGGGVLDCGPKRYMIDLPNLGQLYGIFSNITIRGVPGQTVLDFSRTVGFYNGGASDDGIIRPFGFIRTAGTKGNGTTTNVGIMLTNDLIASDGIVGMITSGTRSGSTITLEFDAPLSANVTAGRLIWVLGDPAISGEEFVDPDGGVFNSQQCFFTVFGRTMGKTIPVAITGVPSATSLTFTYAGSLIGQDPVMDLRSNPYVLHASDVMQVPDSSIFSRNERVQLGSLEENGVDNEHVNIGEYQLISNILTPSLVRFHGSVRDSYLMSDAARVFKLDQIVNLTFEGLTIIGKGHNSGLGRGDVALNLTQTHNLTIRRCEFYDCDLMSAFIFNASLVLVEDCTIVQDQRDQAGRESGTIDIQYGINYGGCVEDITIQHNQCFGGRHFAVQGGSTSDDEFGVARVIRILNNFCTGLWLDPISTHQSADTLIIGFNTLLYNRGGINPRHAKKLIVEGNLVIAENDAFLLYNDVAEALVTGNDFDGWLYPIEMKSIDNPTRNIQPDGGAGDATKRSHPFPAGPMIKITNNKLRNGRNSFYCVDTTPGLLVSGLEFDNNSMYHARSEAILILIGNGTNDSRSIASGGYNDTTGIVTLILTASDTRMTIGVPFTLSALTGTGAFAALNGDQKAIRPTATLDTIPFTAAPGSGVIAITGGLILLSTGESGLISSGTYDSATGHGTVTAPASLPNLILGDPFILSDLEGTGHVTDLEGTQTASGPTVSVTTVTFRTTAGNGATTITGGTVVLPLGGFTGSVSNNKIYDCGFDNTSYQMRVRNAMAVHFDHNQWLGTTTFTYGILLEGDASTSCSFMGGSMARTLYSTALFSPSMKGTGHMTDLQFYENVTISAGVAAIRFVTTKDIRVRGEFAPAADDLDSITGMGLYQEALLWTQSSSWDFTIKQGAGFHLLGGTDILIDDAFDSVRVSWNGTKCVETGSSATGGGTGTVTSVSVTTANGVSGTVATATTTPAITLALGAITPTTVAASGAVSGTSITASAALSGASVTANTTNLKAISETYTSPAITAGVLTINLSLGSVFLVSSNANITSLVISNAPASKAASFTLQLTGNGTGYTQVWSPLAFPGGTPPTLTTTNGQRDVICAMTLDGTNWIGLVGGQNI